MRSARNWCRCLLALGLGYGVAAMGQTDVALYGLPDSHLTVTLRTLSETGRISAVTALTTDFDRAEPFENLPAGAATVPALTNRDAFTQPSGNLSFDRGLDFALGDALFDKIWVSSPASTLASDGLGPLYNARSCDNCHVNDGRGQPPATPVDNAISLVLRLSVAPDHAAINHWISTLPDPVYGTQLQEFATSGLAAEYRLNLTYTEQIIALAGGQIARLRTPIYAVADLGYGPLDPNVMFSPRIAPQMIGLGLLDAIPAADILALADPDDANGDGISGRPSIVWSVQYDQPMLGRFGHKAGMPTLAEQVSAAFNTDIGISTPLFGAAAGDCTPTQTGCLAAPMGDGDVRGTEIDAIGLDLVTHYARNLAVPARRNVDDPVVLHGKQIFYDTGCVACHRPKFVTARLPDQPEQSFQLIWPYSDMLLHDMGPGLADQQPGNAEWRTAPLWGVGLTAQVSGSQSFLHDGRARTLLEAVLWHGGEAQAQRDDVTRLPPDDRAALIVYLESL